MRRQPCARGRDDRRRVGGDADGAPVSRQPADPAPCSSAWPSGWESGRSCCGWRRRSCASAWSAVTPRRARWHSSTAPWTSAAWWRSTAPARRRATKRWPPPSARAWRLLSRRRPDTRHRAGDLRRAEVGAALRGVGPVGPGRVRHRGAGPAARRRVARRVRPQDRHAADARRAARPPARASCRIPSAVHRAVDARRLARSAARCRTRFAWRWFGWHVGAGGRGWPATESAPGLPVAGGQAAAQPTRRPRPATSSW